MYYNDIVAPVRKVTTFRIDDDLLVAMDTLRDRDGIPYSEQIRRALRMFLEARGVPVRLRGATHQTAAKRKGRVAPR